MLTVNEKVKIFEMDSRIVYIREYPAGFVANSYRWPAPATRYVTTRNGTINTETYDSKRSHGKGPNWVAVSIKGGIVKKG